MVRFRVPIFGWAVVLPFACNTPRFRNPPSLEATNMAGKPQFASTQWFLCKGQGGMRKHALWLESLILISICSRDPGQHILVKQCLRWAVCLQRISCNNSSHTFSLFLCFWVSLLTVFKSFYHLTAFLLRKQTSPIHPTVLQMLATAKIAWRSATTS